MIPIRAYYCAYMKASIVAGVAAVLILGGFALILIMGGGDENTENESATPFRVSTIKTDVFIKDTEASDFTLVPEETEAWEGTLVKTSIEGRSIIESPDQKITVLDRNSEMTITQNTEAGTTIRLHRGSTWSRIEKTLEQGEFYEIETQNAVATVRGTSFGTFSTGTTTTFVVAEGTVVTVQIDPTTRKRLLETTKEITEGNKAIIETGKTTTVVPITEEDKSDEWYQFNIPSIIKPSEESTQEPSEESTQEPGVVISGVIPDSVTIGPNKKEALILIYGEHFSRVVSVFIGGVKTPSFKLVSDTRIIVLITDIKKTGVLDVAVIDNQSNIIRFNKAITVIEEKPQVAIEEEVLEEEEVFKEEELSTEGEIDPTQALDSTDGGEGQTASPLPALETTIFSPLENIQLETLQFDRESEQNDTSNIPQ